MTIAPRVSRDNDKGEFRMSVCLHEMLMTETFSLRKSDRSEVCFLFVPL